MRPSESGQWNGVEWSREAPAGRGVAMNERERARPIGGRGESLSHARPENGGRNRVRAFCGARDRAGPSGRRPKYLMGGVLRLYGHARPRLGKLSARNPQNSGHRRRRGGRGYDLADHRTPSARSARFARRDRLVLALRRAHAQTRVWLFVRRPDLLDGSSRIPALVARSFELCLIKDIGSLCRHHSLCPGQHGLDADAPLAVAGRHAAKPCHRRLACGCRATCSPGRAGDGLVAAGS
jgi:hypothetical protein